MNNFVACDDDLGQDFVADGENFQQEMDKDTHYRCVSQGRALFFAISVAALITATYELYNIRRGFYNGVRICLFVGLANMLLCFFVYECHILGFIKLAQKRSNLAKPSNSMMDTIRGPGVQEQELIDFNKLRASQ